MRRATPGGAARMREVARASKGHWGYPAERLDAWAAAPSFPDERETRVAEPNAVGFYERLGATVAGETTGSWGRALPVMRIEIG